MLLSAQPEGLGLNGPCAVVASSRSGAPCPPGADTEIPNSIVLNWVRTISVRIYMVSESTEARKAGTFGDTDRSCDERAFDVDSDAIWAITLVSLSVKDPDDVSQERKIACLLVQQARVAPCDEIHVVSKSLSRCSKSVMILTSSA